MTKLKFRPLLIGITGTIASGKSEIVRVFAKNNFYIISADEITYKLWQDKNVLEKINNIFHTIDKSKIRDKVFSNKENLQKLNNLLHPLIFKEFAALIKNSSSEIIIFEVPLLFEAKLEKYFDLIINVSANKKTLLQRLQKRNYLDKKQAEKIISNQFSATYKIDNSDINIDNNFSLNIVQLQVMPIIKMIPHLKKRKVKSFGDYL